MSIAGVTRVLQIVVASLVAGVTVFLMIALALGPVAKPPPAIVAGLPLITAVALLFALISSPMSIVVPRLITESRLGQIAQGPPTSDQDQLVATYQTRTIVGAAMNEGPAFFAAVAFMLEGNPIALGLVLLLLIGIAARFPTVPKVEAWVEDQLLKLAEKRQGAG